MILQELITAKTNPRIELDTILSELCELIINKQNQDSDYYGMVAACVVCPDGQRVYGINYALEDGTRVHAERAAIDACANISPDCIIVTTLSPCNKHMNERHGDSCEDLIESLGITHVYCGYKDPTQQPDTSIETRNPKLRELCKKFADTFLKENFASHGKMFENAKSNTL
jgi:pyrimidine deaminase RibD-like protein